MLVPIHRRKSSLRATSKKIIEMKYVPSLKSVPYIVAFIMVKIEITSRSFVIVISSCPTSMMDMSVISVVIYSDLN